MKNGMYPIAVKESVPEFIDSHGLKFNAVYTGKVRFYREGKIIWSEETAIKRLSKKAAIDDAGKLFSEIMIKSFGVVG